MKAIVRATGEIIEVERQIDYTDGRVWYFNDDDEWETCELQILPEPKPKESIIEGYVAIDEMYDSAFLHTEKPTLASRPFADTGEYYSEWKSNGSTYLLDKGLFPDMDCESEPKKVRITITHIEE